MKDPPTLHSEYGKALADSPSGRFIGISAVVCGVLIYLLLAYQASLYLAGERHLWIPYLGYLAMLATACVSALVYIAPRPTGGNS